MTRTHEYESQNLMPFPLGDTVIRVPDLPCKDTAMYINLMGFHVSFILFAFHRHRRRYLMFSKPLRFTYEKLTFLLAATSLLKHINLSHPCTLGCCSFGSGLGGSRTHTFQGLSLMSLPIGLQDRNVLFGIFRN